MTLYWDRRGLNVTHVREEQGEVDRWWAENKNKCWNPVQGIYVPANYEPTDEELEAFENKVAETVDKVGERGEACLCETVVKNPVTSKSETKIPDSLVPSSNSLA